MSTKSTKTLQNGGLFHVRLTEKNADFVDILCKQNNMSKSAVINLMVTSFRLQSGKFSDQGVKDGN